MLTLYKNDEISEAEYRALDAISQSSLRQFALAPTPLHFWLQRRVVTKITSAMELGTLLHSRLELGESYFDSHIVMPKGMRKGSKAHKEFKKSHQNKILVRNEDAKRIEDMYSSLLEHVGAVKLLSDGFAEESFIGEIDGIKVKGRLDYRNPKHKVIVDLKTALSGNPFDIKGFSKTVRDSKYDWQAAFYLEAIRQATGENYTFVFAVVEKHYPFACSLHTLCEEDLQIAHKEVFECLHIFNEHQKKNDWGSGYGSAIHTINLRSF